MGDSGDMIGPSDPSKLDALRPGDMVFTKLGSFPWWPATVSYCTQKSAKDKNQYRIGTDPQKSKLWVQFFNENSGAFVYFNKTRVFDPKDADALRLKPGSSHFEKQRIAIEMAIQDFYRINGGPEDELEDELEAEEQDSIVESSPNSSVVQSKQSSEPVADQVPSVSRKRKLDVGKTSSRPKPKKPRAVVVAPAETDTEDDESDKSRDLEKADDSERTSAAKKRTLVKPNGNHARLSQKAHAKSDSCTSHLLTIKSLQSSVREKNAELDRKNSQIAELERRLRKLRPKPSGEKVRITLPDLPPEIEVTLPPQSQHATKSFSPKDFTKLVSKMEKCFADFEHVCMRALKADESLTSEAKKAVSTLQPLYDKLREASESVLSREQDVADALRELFKARVTTAEILSCDAGKKVNRISRRSAGNSALLTSLASAVRKEWMSLFETDNEKVTAQKSNSADDEGQNRSVSPPKIPENTSKLQCDIPASNGNDRATNPEKGVDMSSSSHQPTDKNSGGESASSISMDSNSDGVKENAGGESQEAESRTKGQPGVSSRDNDKDMRTTDGKLEDGNLGVEPRMNGLDANERTKNVEYSPSNERQDNDKVDGESSDSSLT